MARLDELVPGMKRVQLQALFSILMLRYPVYVVFRKKKLGDSMSHDNNDKIIITHTKKNV